VDNAISACSATQIIGPLQPCSNQCSIDVSISNIQCDDGGTTETSSDDIFYFNMTVTGINVSGTWFEAGHSISGEYNTTTTLGPFLISDGPVQLFVSDGNNPNCLIQPLVNPPAPCSDPCEITLQSLETGDCDDFGTGPNQGDDIFSVTVVVTVTNGSATTFTVSDGNLQWGPFDYSIPVLIDSLPANGSTLQLEVVDVSNPNCHLIIEVSQDPCSNCNQTIDAGSSQTITCDQNTVDLAISASEVPASFSWMGPNAFNSIMQNVTVSAPGWYFATAVFPDQCTARDSVQVFIDDDVPSVNAGPDKFLSCDKDMVLLDGSMSSIGPDILYLWTDSGGNILSNDIQLQVDSAGTYYFSLLDTVTQCASGIDEVVVADSTDLPLAVIYAHPQDVVNCIVHSVTLTAEEVANAIYIWLYGNQDPVIAGQITVSDPGVYQLQVIDTLTGCMNRDSIIITDLTEYPFLTIDDYGVIDCNNPVVTLDADASQQGPGIILSWYDENQQLLGNDFSIEVSEPGAYFIELIDTINGCASHDTVFVEDKADAPEIDAGSDLRLPCGESETDLAGIGSNYPPNAVIQWTSLTGTIISGGNTLTPHVEGEGWYVLDVFNPDNNCRSMDSVFVNVIDDIPGVFGLSVDSIDCHNASTGQILLNNIEGGTPPYDITLNGQNVSGQTDFLSLAPGSYNLELTDANGCILDTTIVLLNPAPIQITLDPVIELLYKETGLIEAIVSIPLDEIADIQWLPPDYLSCDSCLVTEIIAVEEGEYLLSITDINGCMETASLRLLIRSEHNAFIPNVFSPNGDGINDGFTVFGDENLLRINAMRLYDRWGEILFERLDFAANDPSLGWDGTFRNELMLPGVYVYAIDLLFVDGKIEIVKGDVTLVR
jgi:gliding motility-associated-like protein